MFKRQDDEIVSKFYKLQSRVDVADLLEIEEQSLRYFLYKRRPDNMYKKFTIRKKSGGARTILSPEAKLKNIQKKLAYILTLVYEPKVCVYGFIPDKNIIDNARNHIKRNQIFNIDLKDFFTQIHFGRIRGMLINQPYNIGDEAAITIAQIACFKGILPQGAPSSPIITNMICKPLDNHLLRLAKKHRITYTRYADDLTFSTYYPKFPSAIVHGNLSELVIGRELLEILHKNSFNVNEEKVFLNSRSTRQEVTGLVVNKFPNIKREYIKKLRAILHNCQTHNILYAAKKYITLGNCNNANIISLVKSGERPEIIESWFKNVLKGKINYVKQVKGEEDFTFLKYAFIMNTIFSEEIFDISILDEFMSKVEQNVFILECDKLDTTGRYIQGSGFLLKGLGLITNSHVTESGDFFRVYHFNKQNHINIISNSTNMIKESTTLDYALYEQSTLSSCFDIGESRNLKQGMYVTIIGYPNYKRGNTPYIQNCEITSISQNYMGSIFYTVSGRVVHGASGGIVLDKDRKVVGLLKGGIVNFEDEPEHEMQGFIPIHIVINDINQ